MRLCSAIRGRERWEIDALTDTPWLAEALAHALQQHKGILRASANPVSGRVLVIYSPESHELQVEPLLRDTLQELLSRGAPAEAPAGPGRRPPSSQLLELLPERHQLTRPLLLSGASHTLSILQGLAVVATLNTALGRGPKFIRLPWLRSASSRFLFMGSLLMVLTGANAYFQYLRKKSWRRLARSTESKLRTRVFSAIEIQDLATLDKQGTGQLMNMVARDTARVSSLIDRGVDEAVHNALTILISGTLLLVTSPSLPLIACLPLPFFLLPLRALGRKAAAARLRANEDSDHFTQLLESSLSGIIDVKSFTAEQQEIRRLEEAARRLADSELEATDAASLETQTIQGAFASGFVMMTVYGGLKTLAGKVSQADFARVMFLFPQLLGSIGGVGEALGNYRSAASSAERLMEILESSPSIQSGPVRLPAKQVQGEIVFENISFGYQPSTKVIDDVSLHLRPGETLAIVGPTGSGKSTLLRLLLRLYDVEAGRILLDGQDLRELDVQDLRSAISIVGQEPYLFHGTIRDNVLFGRPGASDEEVLEALGNAGALEFVNALPGRLEAQVGERGRRLSGGQRQRIAIARALLKKAPILALDEATSHLDYETEAAIQRSVRNVSSRMSMIVVAHRLSTIRRANTIVVLDKGRIRERGTHDELLARGGLYAFLWNLQSGE